MVQVVIAINLLISLCCFFVAWKFWRLRRILRRVESVVLVMELYTYNVLRVGPNFFRLRQKRAAKLRKNYRQLQLQLRQLQQILSLLNLGLKIWFRFKKVSRAK
jgi:hypothetical protein